MQEVYEVMGTNVLRLDEDALLMGGIDNDLIVVGSPLSPRPPFWRGPSYGRQHRSCGGPGSGSAGL